MATIFTKIINGEIPSYKVAEDENFYAFLDINPVQKGHTLVVPKQEIDYIFKIDDDMLGKYMAFAKRVAAAIEKAIPCKKVGIAVVGLEVPHAHIHLIPMNEVHDMQFEHKLSLPADEMKAICNNISSQFK